MSVNYITAEQFLKQNEEVQEIFIDWWDIQIGDLFNVKYQDEEGKWDKDLIVTKKDIEKYGEGFFPSGIDGKVILLFQIHHLIQFIEEELNGKINISYNFETESYEILVTRVITHVYETNTDNLLQALWQVACKIASKN